MKIQMFMFVADKTRNAQDRIVGTVRMPPGARVIHAGASPPEGKLAVWAETTSLALDEKDMQAFRLIILRHGDEIPPDHVYRGYILSNPLLFLYEDVKARDRKGVSHERANPQGG